MAFAKYSIANKAYGRLNTNISAGTTTIVLSTAVNLPNSNWIGTIIQYSVVDGKTVVSKREKVLVTLNSAGTLTVTRSFGGDTAQSFNEGDYIYLNIAAEIVSDIQNELYAVGNSTYTFQGNKNFTGDTSFTGTSEKSIYFKNGSGNLGRLGFGSSGAIFTGALSDSFSLRAENSLHLGAGGDNLAMTILANKRVGLGTTAPDYPLHIVAANNSEGLKIIAPTDNPLIHLGVVSGVYSTISGGDSGAGIYFRPDRGNHAGLIHATNTSFEFIADPATALSTTKPAHALAFRSRYWNGTASVDVPDYSIIETISSTTGPVSRLSLKYNTTEYFTLKSNGNIGINNIDPQYSLDIRGLVQIQRDTELAIYMGSLTTNYGRLGYGSSGNIFTGATSNSMGLRAENNLHLGAGGDNLVVTILANRNLGIGTISPTNNLHLHSPTSTVLFHMTNNSSGESSTRGLDALLAGVDAYFYNRENGNLILGVNNQAAITILANKKVGFNGVGNPQRIIHISTGTPGTPGIRMDDGSVANGSVATVLGSVGPTGANTTVQGWLLMDIGGTTRYIPYW